MRALSIALLGGVLVVGIAALARAHDPVVEPVEGFADSLAGPEGLSFTRRDGLAVGTTTGDVRLYSADGSSRLLANVGDRLAGISALRDGRVLAAAFNEDRVWAIERDGTASIFASGIDGANFIIETRNHRILVSAALAGKIFDITSGTPVEFAPGFTFPNGLALHRDHGQRYLYVAETLASRVVRLPLSDDDVPGAIEPVMSGFPLADGLAFDSAGNLWVVGGDTLKVLVRKTGQVLDFSSDPLLHGASNIALGRGRGFKRRDAYLANFGPALGNGTTVVRFRTNHGGARVDR